MIRPSPTDARPVMRRRIRILNAALELFAERGFDAVGIREIADSAGVSKSLINRHFGSKSGLRGAVDEFVMQRFAALLEIVLGPADEFGEGLAAARAARLQIHLPEILPILRYLRRSLLDDSAAGLEMLQSYLRGTARNLGLAWPDDALPADETAIWLGIAVMMLQLGPIFLESHFEALTGHSPFTTDSIAARSRVYALLEPRLREVRDDLSLAIRNDHAGTAQSR